MSTTHDRRLIFCVEADRAYRLRHGTAKDAYRRGLIPGRTRGRKTLISAKRAEELWGAP